MHVTVTVIAHNARSHVAACLRSIQGQTYEDWDAVVVDDGSRDGTGEIVRSIAETDPRIALLSNPECLGRPKSRNQSWRAAKGPLIAILDSDDTSYPDRLEKQVAFLQSHPAIDVLGSGVELVDSRCAFQGIRLLPEHHEQLVQNVYRSNPFANPSVMIRRNVLEQLGGYDEQFQRSQDYELWIRASTEFKFHNLQEPLVRYRIRKKTPISASLFCCYAILKGAWHQSVLHKRWWYAARPLVAACLERVRG